MITLLKRVRKSLIESSSARQYLFYAIGEILLVMIGILLALQINNWNQQRLDNKLEKRYLSDLLHDLERDSVALAQFVVEANNYVRSKQLLQQVIDDPGFELDSLWYYVTLQWAAYRGFVPITITIDEMRSSSKLDVIRNVDLRRDIVGLYNFYEMFNQDEKLFHESSRDFLELARKHLPYIGIESTAQARAMLDIPIVVNTIRTNFASHHRDSVTATWRECQNLMQHIRSYLNQL